MYQKAVNIILFAFFIGITIGCNSPKAKYQAYTLTAKAGEYSRDNTSQYLTIPVVLNNNTNDTLKYIMWTCPENWAYGIQSKMLTSERLTVCDATFPEELILPPHKSKESKTKFVFNNSFKGGLVEYKIRFYLYDNPKEYINNHSSNSDLEIIPKKLQSNVVQMMMYPRGM